MVAATLRSPRRGDIWKFGFLAVFGLVYILQITNGFPFLVTLFQNTVTELETKTLLQIIIISMIIDQTFRLFFQKALYSGMMPYLILPFTRRSLVLFHESLALMTLYNLLTLLPPFICFLLSALLLGPSALLTGLAALLFIILLSDHFLYRLGFLIPSQIIRWTVMISMIAGLIFFVQKISEIPPAILDFLSLNHLILLLFVTLICIASSTIWIYQSRLSPYDGRNSGAPYAKINRSKLLNSRGMSPTRILWRMITRNKIPILNHITFLILPCFYFLSQGELSNYFHYFLVTPITFQSCTIVTCLFSWENSFYPLVHVLIQNYETYVRRAVIISCSADAIIALVVYTAVSIAKYPQPITTLVFISTWVTAHGAYLPYIIWYSSRHLEFFSLLRFQPFSSRTAVFFRFIPLGFMCIAFPMLVRKLTPIFGLPLVLSILALPGVIGFLFMKPVIRSAGRRYEQSKYTIF